MLDDLPDRFRQGDRRALTRLLSLLSRGEHTEEILSALGSPKKHARVIGITGSAGVGKSTLVGKLLGIIREAKQSVAVLACDPQSPLSGGALLGDRFRMPSGGNDDGIFIRSIATPGGRGAVTERLPEMVRLLECYGFDVILIETVGSGQGDTLARNWVDVMVLLVQAETGDDLQWEKAGVLEVADLVVIHKADLPGSDRVEAQVLSMLELVASPGPKVLRVSSKTGDGARALWEAISLAPLRSKQASESGLLLRLLLDRVTRRYREAEKNSQLAEILKACDSGTKTFAEALDELGELLISSGK